MTTQTLIQRIKQISLVTLAATGLVGSIYYTHKVSTPIRTEVETMPCSILAPATGEWSSEGIEYSYYLAPSGEKGIAQIPVGKQKKAPYGTFAHPKLPEQLPRGKLELKTKVYRGLFTEKETYSTREAYISEIESERTKTQ